jgi:DNA repair exonuclease SbcCD ATPase subunit
MRKTGAPKSQMKLHHWIILALIAIIAALILFDKDPPATDTTAFKQQIEKDRTVIRELQSELAETLARIKQDSLQQVSEAEAYRKDVDSLTSRIGQLKRSPRVITVLAENPEVEALVDQQDSLIVTQAARIDTLEVNLSDLRIDLAQVKRNFEGQIQAYESIRESQTQIIAAQEKEIRRHKREKRAAIGAGIAGVLAALILR